MTQLGTDASNSDLACAGSRTTVAMKLTNRDFALLTAMALLAIPAHAQPTTQDAASERDATASAQKLMDEGAALYAKADWAGAHVAFMKAWQIVQHRAIATNLADVELRLGLYVEAGERLKYLISTLPGDHEEEVATLEAQLAECRQHATSLRIETDVGDAVVRVNGKEMGKVSAVGEMLVEPGPAVVVVSRPGYRDARRSLVLNAGDAKTLDFKMEPVAPPSSAPRNKPMLPAASPPPTPRSEASPTRNLVAIGGLALTVTAGVVGVVYWRRSVNSNDESEHYLDAAGGGRNACLPGREVDPEACRMLSDTLVRYDRETNVMRGAFVTAGVLGVATAATYFLWPTKEGTRRATIAPWSTAAGGGVTLTGRF